MFHRRISAPRSASRKPKPAGRVCFGWPTPLQAGATVSKLWEILIMSPLVLIRVADCAKRIAFCVHPGSEDNESALCEPWVKSERAPTHRRRIK